MGLIGRMLGPDGPEISCETCFDELDRYVEVELAGRDAEVAGEPADQRVPGMRAHLQGCPACHEEYESLRALAER